MGSKGLTTLQIKLLKLCNLFLSILIRKFMLFKLRDLNAKTDYLSLIYLFLLSL